MAAVSNTKIPAKLLDLFEKPIPAALVTLMPDGQPQATPVWVDLDAIEEFYRAAMQLTLDTGVEHEVDHIVPLNGKKVCGLHVAYNLQVITRKANRQKFASVPPSNLDARLPQIAEIETSTVAKNAPAIGVLW